MKTLMNITTFDMKCIFITSLLFLITCEKVSCSPNIEPLRLDRHNLTRVTTNMFVNLTSLEKLYLNHNFISRIDSGAFSLLPNLLSLNLENNNLNRLEAKTFSGLKSLEFLDLSFNPISIIDSGAFTPMSSSLRFLYLERTELKLLRGDYFLLHFPKEKFGQRLQQQFHASSASGLQESTFDTSVTISSSDSFPSLQELKLSHSKVEEIQANSLTILTSLTSLDLTSNRLQSDTLLQTLNQGQKSHRKKTSHKNCLFPESLVNLYLSGNNLSKLKLHSDEEEEESDGQDSDIFRELHNLEVLDLSFTSIDSTSFFKKGYHIKNKESKWSNLNTLKLIGNGIQFIPSSSTPTSVEVASNINSNYSVSIRSKLNELYLDQNLLNSAPSSDVLKLMPSLELISLSGNNIKRIPGGCFKLNSHITFLNLSNNSLSVLDSGSFEGLSSSLESIDLSNNVMRSVSQGVFEGLNELTSVNFDNNWFQFIPNNLLRTSSSTRIKILSFNSNPLIKIREDLSVEGFQLKSLETLNLESGNITVIASHDFLSFPSIHELSLKSNHISKISPGSFKAMTSLSSLDLSQNLLTILPEERLSSLIHLKNLNLSRNHLLEVPMFSKDLTSLQVLDISFNRFTKFESLAHLSSSLEEIFLNDNMIAWIASNIFNNLTSIKRIDLRNNFLNQVFAETLFAPIEASFESLLISGNPFHCDCRLLSLWEWINRHPKIISSKEGELTCSQPDSDLRNKKETSLISSLHPIDFCPLPLISKIEAVKVDSSSLTIKWEVQNDSLAAGFNLDQYQSDSREAIGSQRLSSEGRTFVMKELKPETSYTICIEANGRYSKSGQPATVSKHDEQIIVEGQSHHRIHAVQSKDYRDNNFSSSNRKCIQATTSSEASTKQMIIMFENMSLVGLAIILSSLLFVMFSIISIAGVIVKVKNKRRRRKIKQSKEQQDNKSKQEDMAEIDLDEDIHQITSHVHSIPDLHLHHHLMHPSHSHLDIQLTQQEEELPDPVFPEDYITYRHFSIPLNENGMYN